MQREGFRDSVALWLRVTQLLTALKTLIGFGSIRKQRTCARHLRRIGVCAVVANAADAVGSSFVGGAAVDGTLLAQLIPLGCFKESRRACWVKTDNNLDKSG